MPQVFIEIAVLSTLRSPLVDPRVVPANRWPKQLQQMFGPRIAPDTPAGMRGFVAAMCRWGRSDVVATPNVLMVAGGTARIAVATPSRQSAEGTLAIDLHTTLADTELLLMSADTVWTDGQHAQRCRRNIAIQLADDATLLMPPDAGCPVLWAATLNLIEDESDMRRIFASRTQELHALRSGPLARACEHSASTAALSPIESR